MPRHYADAYAASPAKLFYYTRHACYFCFSAAALPPLDDCLMFQPFFTTLLLPMPRHCFYFRLICLIRRHVYDY